MAQNNITRYRTNYQDEIDSAALYRTLAAAEENQRLAEVYRRLAATEQPSRRCLGRTAACDRPAGSTGANRLALAHPRLAGAALRPTVRAADDQCHGASR